MLVINKLYACHAQCHVWDGEQMHLLDAPSHELLRGTIAAGSSLTNNHDHKMQYVQPLCHWHIIILVSSTAPRTVAP
jgi:hypothetical protein